MSLISGLFGPPNIKNFKEKKNVEKLIQALDYENDPKIRWEAAKALGELKENRALNQLILKLDDSDVDVRSCAADALEKIGWHPDKTNEALYLVAKRDFSGCVKIGAPCVEPLIKKLLIGNDAHNREKAAETLGKIGDHRAVEPLIKILHDNNEEVRKEAVNALGKIGDGRATEPLIQAFKDYYLENAACAALRDIGSPAIDPLIRALKNDDSKIRLNAVVTLGWIRDSRVVDPLISMLKHKDPFVRRNAATGLGSTRDPRAFEPLHQFLKSEDINDRREAALALGALKDPRAIDPLIELFDDRDMDLRVFSAKSIFNIGSPATERLIHALHHQNYKIRIKTTEILSDFKDSRAVEPLIEAYKDNKGKDKDFHHAIIYALAKIGDARAVDILIDALESSSSFPPQYKAAEALGEIGDARAVDPLIHLKNSTSVSNVREITSASLERLVKRGVLSETDIQKIYAEKKDDSH